MELRQVRAFTTIAETLSFRKASKKLRVSQPSLSVQIKQLEQEIGTELFFRTKRHVSLTRAGEVFLQSANEVLSTLERSASAARHAGAGEAGTIRVGFVPTASFMILPRLFEELRTRFPLVKVELKEWSESAQIRELESGALDIGIGHLESFSDRIASMVLARENFVLVLPKQHKAARKKEVDLKDLANDLLLMPRQDLFPTVHRTIANVFAANEVAPSRSQAVEHVQTAIALAAAGIGFAFVPESAKFVSPSSVVFRPLKTRVPEFETLVLWSRNNVDPLVEKVLSILLELQQECLGPKEGWQTLPRSSG